ncbi:AAA family ATPase [Salinimicrobium sp. WS361]|uniref:AAA family ATPase n=1 Tax=Salinimicrobium sp. WS361 TaxID=3425123 RepID=UPI003D6FADC1
MNQVLLTRLFKSIEGDENTPLMKIAHNIIEDENKKGHTKLANKLQAILNKKLDQSQRAPALKQVKEHIYKIPLDRRYRLPLATHIEHEFLRHEMVLQASVEDKIFRIEKEYAARERLAHYGLKPRRKILFYGSSGCGKSMGAERIAWDLGLPFHKVRFDSIMSSYLGESAANLQKLFDSIKDYPCVLLLDEFDIIGKQRELASNDVGEMHRIVNILLGLLEEYDGEGILIATTNLEGSLDKALFRRFDDFIELPKPSNKEVKELLVMTFSALNLSKEIDLNLYAKKMIGFSSALIVKIAQDAAKKSIINSTGLILPVHLDQALEENMALNKS